MDATSIPMMATIDPVGHAATFGEGVGKTEINIDKSQAVEAELVDIIVDATYDRFKGIYSTYDCNQVHFYHAIIHLQTGLARGDSAVPDEAMDAFIACYAAYIPRTRKYLEECKNGKIDAVRPPTYLKEWYDTYCFFISHFEEKVVQAMDLDRIAREGSETMEILKHFLRERNDIGKATLTKKDANNTGNHDTTVRPSVQSSDKNEYPENANTSSHEFRIAKPHIRVTSPPKKDSMDVQADVPRLKPSAGALDNFSKTSKLQVIAAARSKEVQGQELNGSAMVEQDVPEVETKQSKLVDTNTMAYSPVANIEKQPEVVNVEVAKAGMTTPVVSEFIGPVAIEHSSPYMSTSTFDTDSAKVKPIQAEEKTEISAFNFMAVAPQVVGLEESSFVQGKETQPTSSSPENEEQSKDITGQKGKTNVSIPGAGADWIVPSDTGRAISNKTSAISIVPVAAQPSVEVLKKKKPPVIVPGVYNRGRGPSGHRGGGRGFRGGFHSPRSFSSNPSHYNSDMGPGQFNRSTIEEQKIRPNSNVPDAKQEDKAVKNNVSRLREQSPTQPPGTNRGHKQLPEVNKQDDPSNWTYTQGTNPSDQQDVKPVGHRQADKPTRNKENVLPVNERHGHQTAAKHSQSTDGRWVAQPGGPAYIW